MSVIFRIFFVAFTLFASLTQAETLTLEQVVAAVRQGHPAISQAQWDANAHQAKKGAEAWIDDPEVGVMFEESPLSSPSPGNADMTTWSVSQMIPYPGTLITKSKSLKYEVQAKNWLVTSAERATVFDAKKAYFELIANQRTLTDKQAVIAYYRQILSTMERTYQTQGKSVQQKGTVSPDMDGGMGSASGGTVAGGSMRGAGLGDILMVKMKKAEAEAEIHDLHHQHEALTAKINLMMGREPEKHFKPVMPKTKALKWNDKSLSDKVLAQNSDVAALKAMVKKSQQEVSLAKQQQIPQLTAEAIYNRRQNRDNAYSLGFGINVPLWLNKNRARIKQAKAEAMRMRAEFETEKLGVKTDFYYLLYHAKRHYLIVRKYQGEILPLAKSAANVALASYQVGLTEAPSAVQKFIGYHDASAMYWKMWADYQTEYAMLEQLIGEEL